MSEKAKMFRKDSASILDGSGKAYRAESTFAMEALQNKRHLLSQNPEARVRLDKLDEAYHKAKKEYPAFVGLTLFGSQVKGYATGESDFDGNIYVNSKKALENFDIKNLKEQDLVTPEEAEEIIKNQPRAFDQKTKMKFATGETVNLKYKKILNQFFSSAGLEDQIKPKSLSVEFVDADFFRKCANSDKEMDYACKPVVALFNLSLDKDINSYREIVIEELEKQGEKGKKKWQEIMEVLGNNESLSFLDQELLGPQTDPERHNKLYPTLDKARKHFLLKQK
jgi:hypothetical protein